VYCTLLFAGPLRRELTRGSKRIVQQRQEQNQQSAATSQALSARCQHVRAAARAQEQAQHAVAREAADQQLQQCKHVFQEACKQEAAAKRALVQAQRMQEAKALQEKQLRTKAVSPPGSPLGTGMQARLRALATGEFTDE
jgi:hypothetical protein